MKGFKCAVFIFNSLCTHRLCNVSYLSVTCAYSCSLNAPSSYVKRNYKSFIVLLTRFSQVLQFARIHIEGIPSDNNLTYESLAGEQYKCMCRCILMCAAFPVTKFANINQYCICIICHDAEFAKAYIGVVERNIPDQEVQFNNLATTFSIKLLIKMKMFLFT